jgi:hypothetical protein
MAGLQRFQKQDRAVAFVIRRVDDDGRVEQEVGHVIWPLLLAGADRIPGAFSNPFDSALFQFGMIFVFPRASGSLKGLDLAQAQKLFLGRPGEKRTTTPLAGHGVDFSRQLLGNDDMSTFGDHREFTRYGSFKGPLHV